MDVVKKLKLKSELPLWLLNIPENRRSLFVQFDIREKLAAKATPTQLLVFVHDRQELVHQMAAIGPHLSFDTVFWICYPKKSGSIGSDLSDRANWEFLFQSGFRGQTAVSLDDDWSGFRTTRAPKKSTSICDLPMEDRRVDGIDFVNRTVQLPADAVAIVKQHAGMSAFFDALSFTHKKEYMLSIVEAKQEGTRKRRIDKMVEMLGEKMEVQKVKQESKRK